MVELGPGQVQVVYLELVMHGVVIEPIFISDAQSAHRGLANGRAALWCIAGFLGAMSLFRTFLFVLVPRERAHLYYALYTVSTAIFTVWTDAEAGLPNSLGFGFGIAVLLQATALLFATAVLDTRERTPRLDRWLWACLTLTILPYPLFFVFPAAYMLMVSPVSMLTVGIASCAGIIRWRDGYRPAAFYLLGWLTLLIALTPTVAFNFGFTADLPNQWLMPLGLAGEAAFAALALADRSRMQSDYVADMLTASQRFVPVEFLQALRRDDLREVQQGDSVEQTMTVYFSDIRSFTSIVEKLSPEETIRLVNDYLSAMGPAIRDHGGFVDKFIGDAVMALFATPDQAVAAAVASHAILAEFNANRAGAEPLQIGVGLHTGALMLGTVGNRDRLSCTVLGDTVNLASRTESLTKRYGANLVITEQAREAMAEPDRFQVRRLDRVAVKGKSEPTTLYEVLDGLPGTTRRARLASRERFEGAHDAFVAGRLAAASDGFKSCLETDPTDRAATLYVDRCRQLQERGLPEGWDGVVRMSTK